MPCFYSGHKAILFQTMLKFIKQLVHCHNSLCHFWRTVNKRRIYFFSFIHQRASRHQLHQYAQFPAHQPALHPVTTLAASKDTNSHRSTTLPHLLHTRPCAPITAPVPVHLQAAPRLVATPCIIRRLILTGNVITPLNQRRERRNTTSSVNTTGRIKIYQEWNGIREEGEQNVLACC